MKKKEKKPDPPANTEGWQVVYTGFAMIMLCFFIMLSSFSSIKPAAVMQFVRSFVESLSMLPGGSHMEEGTTVLPTSHDIVHKASELAKIFQDLREAAKKSKAMGKGSVDLFLKGGDLVMRLSDTVLFNPGEADFLPSALDFLKHVGGIISRSNGSVRIEGHTDNVPIHTERFPSNWELSTARAVSVLRYLVETLKIPATRLFAVGFGEYQPLAANDTPDNRAKNRRVEIIFEKVAQNVPASEIRILVDEEFEKKHL